MSARARPMRVVVACQFFVQGERAHKRTSGSGWSRSHEPSKTSSIGASRGEQVEPAAANSERYLPPIHGSLLHATYDISCLPSGCPEIGWRAFSKAREGHRVTDETRRRRAWETPLDRLRPRGRSCSPRICDRGCEIWVWLTSGGSGDLVERAENLIWPSHHQEEIMHRRTVWQLEGVL